MARERFRELLLQNAPEAEWQALFTEHPYVLSRSLPLRLSPTDIVPLGRPGQSEADFIFYQRSKALITGYGVIELKRPDSRVLTSPRNDIVILTREADTAIRQASHYARALKLPERAIFLGASQHLFVIMGLSSHLTKTISSEFVRNQTGGLVPMGCQILPYDELLRRFESSIPDRLLVLAPLIPQSSTAGVSPGDGRTEGLTNLLDTIRDSGTHLESLLDYATRRARQLARDFGDETVDYESISQEALLLVLQSQTKIPDERGLLDRVIAREIRDARRHSPHERSHVPLEVLSEGRTFGDYIDLSIFGEFERQQKSVDLWDAVGRLPSDLAHIVQLVVLGGFDVREIAQILDLSPRNVRRKYEQAIVQLNALLRAGRDGY
ncbi:MAG TPA: sigma-70 family RNA polymerase sigma factor [Pyrinomonadaceae bacterium]|nr:sigma-70 family RNA polymerase sigma factor [Pyrinomonadaceae bacterium]